MGAEFSWSHKELSKALKAISNTPIKEILKGKLGVVGEKKSLWRCFSSSSKKYVAKQ